MADLAVEVLKEIRDELRTTRKELTERIDGTNARLDGTNTRVDSTNTRIDLTNTRLDRLEHRQSDMETRLASELVAVAGAINDLRDVILEDRKLRQTVDDHETRLNKLERRAG